MKAFIVLPSKRTYTLTGLLFESFGAIKMSLAPRVLAVVPVRGGSKGVPRKNIRPLNGIPLVGHTLQTAQQVDRIDLLVVSTEDHEIAQIAKGYGVQVVLRPDELASDTATTESALLHTLDVLEQEGEVFDVILVLEATSPLRSVDTIERAISMISEPRYQSVLAVRETYENIGLMNDGYFRPVVPDAPRRRQLRAPFYIESSTIYAAKTSYLREQGTLVCENWGALVVPEEEAADINTEDDFLYVEFLSQMRSKKTNA